MVHKQKLIQKIKGKNYLLVENTRKYEGWWWTKNVKEVGGIVLVDKALVPMNKANVFAEKLLKPID